MKVSFVIPTKNEHGNIERLIQKINEITSKYNILNEILIIDDNSNDGTIEDVKNLMKFQNNIHLIQRKNFSNIFPKFPKKWKYLGIGSAHKIGYNLAKGDLIISMDADLSHPPEKITTMINLINSGHDICVGSRYVRGGGSDKNILNQVISRLGSLYLSLFLGIKINDLSNGFRVIRKTIWEKIKNKQYTNDNNFLIESLYYAHKNGAKITESPVFFKEREIGESKTPLLKETLKAILLPIRVKLKGRI
jgi:dolichol-phosphate mannosyltransferase